MSTTPTPVKEEIRSNIVITIKCALRGVEWAHAIEKQLDDPLERLGFARHGTSHTPDGFEIRYWQYGYALSREPNSNHTKEGSRE